MPLRRPARFRRASALGGVVLATGLGLGVLPAGAAASTVNHASAAASSPGSSSGSSSGSGPQARWPHGPRTPGDEPLPGYTIVNPPLAPLKIEGEPTRVEQGVRRHAAYVVETPARWNGELPMWAHGYRGTGRELTVDPPAYGLRERLLRQGYAWGASSYVATTTTWPPACGPPTTSPATPG